MYIGHGFAVKTSIKLLKRLDAYFLVILFISALFPMNAFAKDNSPSVVTDDTRTLIMGVFPRRDGQTTIKSFKPLANYLSKKLNRKVELETTFSFDSFWNGIKEKKYDIVHFNQYHYVRSHKELGYNVIVMNEEHGKSTISSVILVKKDSGINSVKDIQGKKLAFGGGPKAMVSYILPIYVLKKQGVKSYEYTSFFAKNPPNAVMTLYFDKTDIAGVGNHVIEMGVIKNNIDTSKLKKIAESESIVHLPWAVKNDMSSKLKDEIKSLLINLNKTPQTRKILKSAKVTNFVPASDADYDRTREIIEDVIGIQY